MWAIRRIEFSELPKTISGKIRRVELRKREQTRLQDEQRNPEEYWVDDFPELRS
jgi:acetyl-CoA synthetase